MQEALREAKEITIEVKDTVGIVRDMVALPHMAKVEFQLHRILNVRFR